jgi:3-methyladenine DNA glycosylase AlkD
MTLKEVMAELESYGSPSIKKVLLKHGVKEPFWGVKVEHMKIIQKKVKKNYVLANELFLTGNADAMYLAGLVADDEQMTKEDLRTWAKLAVSNNISEYTVPWVAASGKHGYEMALEWIDASEEHIAAAGWATLSGLVSLKPDDELDLPVLKKLIGRVSKNIHAAPNRVRYTMNGFLIAAGTYVLPLKDDVLAAAAKIGAITVDMNGTACKVPEVAAYIDKAVARGQGGKKKKTIKC